MAYRPVFPMVVSNLMADDHDDLVNRVYWRTPEFGVYAFRWDQIITQFAFSFTGLTIDYEPDNPEVLAEPVTWVRRAMEGMPKVRAFINTYWDRVRTIFAGVVHTPAQAEEKRYQFVLDSIHAKFTQVMRTTPLPPAIVIHIYMQHLTVIPEFLEVWLEIICTISVWTPHGQAKATIVFPTCARCYGLDHPSGLCPYNVLEAKLHSTGVNPFLQSAVTQLNVPYPVYLCRQQDESQHQTQNRNHQTCNEPQRGSFRGSSRGLPRRHANY
ncbi:hypothetical protein CVT25_014763 [Psilocybe cyanescens]|uniref:Uncharacterized protein n=1 Tax=Psilocybe cyanescens TaxID=93625 RepID=A0A409X5C0_PSICY|nr:hypothetical protein CVT25_014763 [Psilocybe cyanescens]